MPSKLDDISLLLGEIKAKIEGLERRAEDDRQERDREHKENQISVGRLSAMLDDRARQFTDYQIKTDERLMTLELLGPVVAGLQLTKAKLTSLAAIGFVVLVSVGWVLEAGLKWLVEWVLSHVR